MDKEQTSKFIAEAWHKEDGVVQHLKDYISIPSASPMFDPEWNTNGLQEQVVALLSGWAKKQAIASLKVEVLKNEGLTPLIFCEIDSTIPGETLEQSFTNTILLYGHFDKQPPLTSEWTAPFEPYKPVIHENRLYGRGGADDGYSIFSALTAIAALEAQNLPHARCVLIVEGCEESGSIHLPQYIDHLTPRIGTPNLIICLDSGTANYEQLWLTSSLRGLIAGTLTVKILEEGVHSGTASGVVPSSFRIIRQLLSRVEDQDTGKVLVPEFWTEIPPGRIAQAKVTADALGAAIFEELRFVKGARTVDGPIDELLLNRTWRPAISVTGAAGLPSLESAGNVLRTFTSIKLSIRVPPTVDLKVAAAALKTVLEADPPYGAQVTFTAEKTSPGWDSPALAPWLEESLNVASQEFFDGKPACVMGEGGSIPFMGMLGVKFPQAQFAITGLLGPGSNAHGPNEFMDIPYSERLTGAVSKLIFDHHKAPK